MGSLFLKKLSEKDRRAYRMAKEEIIHNWLRLIKQLIQNYFITIGIPVNEKKLFQKVIPDAAWNNVNNFIRNLKNLPIWMNKDLSISIFGGKRNIDFWESIFESGITPDNQQVMPMGLNIMEMIKNIDED